MKKTSTNKKVDDSRLSEVTGGCYVEKTPEKEPPLLVDIAADIATAPLPGPPFTSTILRLFKKWF